MRRREFITLVGGAVAGWPLAARAQQPAIPVIGFLNTGSSQSQTYLLAAFRQGLSEADYVEGKNVAIEYRWAEGRYDRLPAMASDLVRRQVAVIAANSPGAVAAKALTKTIPIVFSTGTDPIASGFVDSLNRPGGNLTGVYFFSADMEAKRMGLLHELVPAATTVAVLLNPTYPNFDVQTKEVQEAARMLGLQIKILHASTEQEIEAAFASLAQWRALVLLIGADAFFNNQHAQIVALTARYAVPAIYEQREFAEAGGLVSYGTSLPNAYRQVGNYVGRILKGEKPTDLPVVQSTKFELVINLKTAKALGIEVPQNLLVAADEVIE
ncbi:MAG: ABC transporter substrate-binding protein [Candidatus Sulfotelmatobacter sp.]